MDTRDDDGTRDGVDADRSDVGADRDVGDGRDPGAGGRPDESTEPTDSAGVTASAPGAADARTDEDDDVGLSEVLGEDDPRPLGPLEPGSPNPENVFFVVLGALATAALFATVF